jgi:polyhydroxyalkanoate synthesis regulator phasin
MERNNTALEASLKQTQQDLDVSIRKSLTANSGKIDQLVRRASLASQDQVKEYVASLRTENMQMVKDYFRMSSGQQKQYVEELLVDFAKYLQQQRSNDLQLVQTRINSIEQNTSVFRQETEQILTSIISTVGTAPTKETKY